MEQYGIQYNININQYALYKTKLDLVDCAILDYLIKFCGIDDKKIRQLTITEGGKMYQYTWINFNYLIKQMPLLRIKDKSAVSRRVDKIKKEGFIKIFRAPDRSLYVRLTEKIKEIQFVGVAEKQQSKGERCCSKTTGVLLDNNRGVVEKQQHNNNTNNNNTNNNKEDLILKDTRSFNIRSAKQGFASPEKENSPVSLSEQKDPQPPIPPNPLPPADQSANPEMLSLNELIDLFKEVNPSYERLFPNKTQRSALERLVKKYGTKEIAQFIEILPTTNKEQFAPVITTPVQLENKLGSLISFLQRMAMEREQNKIIEI